MAKLFEQRKIRYLIEMSEQEMLDLRATLNAVLQDDNLPELMEIYAGLDSVELGITIESITNISDSMQRTAEEIIDL
jgi:hypothetical protein